MAAEEELVVAVVRVGKVLDEESFLQRGGEMPVNTLHASFLQRFNQLLLMQPTTNAK